MTLRILFLGQILMNKNFSKEQLDYTRYLDYDIVVSDLENTIGEQSIRDDKFSHHINEDLIDELSTCNINVISLANNHTLDCGTEGFQKLLTKLNNKVVTLTGLDDNIYSIKGHYITFIGVTTHSSSNKLREHEINNIFVMTNEHDFNMLDEKVEAYVSKGVIVVIVHHWHKSKDDDTYHDIYLNPKRLGAYFFNKGREGSPVIYVSHGKPYTNCYDIYEYDIKSTAFYCTNLGNALFQTNYPNKYSKYSIHGIEVELNIDNIGIKSYFIQSSFSSHDLLTCISGKNRNPNI